MEDSRNLNVATIFETAEAILLNCLFYVLFTGMWPIVLLAETILCFGLTFPNLITIYLMCKHFILRMQAI